MGKILVLGGAGYIGSILTRKLLEAITLTRYDDRDYNELTDYGDIIHTIQYDDLTVYDNLLYKQITLTEYAYRGDFHFVHGDVRNHAKLLPYIQEADVIIHLAAIVGFPACERNPILAREINYSSVKFVVDNMRKDQKLIMPCTNSMYGTSTNEEVCTETSPINPISVYGKTKCDAEKYILDSGNGISLRLATVFGIRPRHRLDLLVNDFVYKAVNDGYIVLFEKDFKRNYIHIQDVAHTIIFMINEYEKYNNQIFNVGLSNANLSKEELALKIKEYLPKFVIKYDEFNKDPDQRNYIVSNEKIESTGWKAYYSVDDGIKELIKAYEIIKHNNKLFTNL